MEGLCDLLFELSSSERMNIMQSLLQESLKLSQVSQKLDMTVTEASRHMQRLSNVHLISKNVDGTFSPTKYGELAISLLSSLDFISANRQYFLEHKASQLPLEFRYRLGELSNCEFDRDTVKVFEHARQVLMNAEEYIWIQSYQHLLWNAPIIQEKIENGVDFRFILPANIVPPEDYEPGMTIMKATRILEEIHARVLVTEGEASFSLPYEDGRIDYAAFMSRDPEFLKWCRDLFLLNWEMAR